MNAQYKLKNASTNVTTKAKSKPVKKPISMRHRTITSEKEFNALESDWNLLCERTDSHVFQTYDWNRTWWNHFGAKGDLQIFALYDRDTLVGIAPLFFDRTNIIGMKPYSCLRMICSQISCTEDGVIPGFKSHSDYLQFLIDKDYVNSFFKHFLHFLMHEIYFDELILEEVPENSSTLAILDHDFSADGFEISVSNASSGYNVLPEDNWEEYLKTLKSDVRNKVRKCQKRIGNGGKKFFHVKKIEQSDDIKQTLNQFVELHEKQWNSKGMPSTFAETSMHRFFMDVSPKLHKNGYLKINTLQPEGTEGLEHCIAIDTILEYKDRMYGQHRAMDIKSTYIKKAPGKVLLTVAIKDAIKSNKLFDFLGGLERYKKRFANTVFQNKTIRLSVSSGHRKWLGKILSAIQCTQKRKAIECSRLQVVNNQNRSAIGIMRYICSVFKRIAKRFNNN